MSRLKNLKKYIKQNKSRALKHTEKVFDVSKFFDEDIFYMLCFCIMVPGGKAVLSEQALVKLKSLDFYYKDYRKVIILKTIKSLVRFPNQKTDRLLKLKNRFSEVLGMLKHLDISSQFLRANLVNRIDGLGFKAASHFLRNLGIKDLAIIDTHVLKYAHYFVPFASEFRKLDIPSTKKRYEYVEEYFNKWAKKEFNLQPSELDWLIWCFESGNDVEALEC